VHRRSWAPWAAAAIVVVAALTWWWLGRVAEQPDQPLIRLNVDLGREAVAGELVTAAISPDGSRIVFPRRGADGRIVLATRRLDEAKVTELPGTGGGFSPFFSPDGQWIGFFANRALQKILVQGGAPVILATGSTPRGGTWDWDGNSIIAALNNRSMLFRVPAAGGSIEPVTHFEAGEISHRWPQILPGGRAVLFTGRSPSLNTYENAAIDVVTLKTNERKTLWRGGYFGRYLPTRGKRGHLVYIHEGTLFAVPFDPKGLALEGTPVPIVDYIASDPTSGGGQFDVSATGTLVYLSGTGRRSWPMSLLDASGKTETILPNPGMYYSPRFSPDGRKLAFAIEAGNGSDIFVYDFASHSTTRLTFTQQGNIEPLWTPDGKYIVYRSIEPAAIWWIRADGGGEPQLLRKGGGEAQACSFTPDGKRLAFNTINLETGIDILILPLDLTDPDHPKPGTPQPLLTSPAAERYAAFSPDGQWIAYASDESSRQEVYVRRVTEPGGKWQISTSGGNMPMWSRQGQQIFYVVGGRIMVADYEVTGNSFVRHNPRLWSPAQVFDPGYLILDLAPDAKRFAVFVNPAPPTENPATVHVTFLLHFFDELRRRVPAGNNR
jgi:serine/threonine-protein kinase